MQHSVGAIIFDHLTAERTERIREKGVACAAERTKFHKANAVESHMRHTLADKRLYFERGQRTNSIQRYRGGPGIGEPCHYPLVILTPFKEVDCMRHVMNGGSPTPPLGTLDTSRHPCKHERPDRRFALPDASAQEGNMVFAAPAL